MRKPSLTTTTLLLLATLVPIEAGLVLRNSGAQARVETADEISAPAASSAAVSPAAPLLSQEANAQRRPVRVVLPSPYVAVALTRSVNGAAGSGAEAANDLVQKGDLAAKPSTESSGVVVAAEAGATGTVLVRIPDLRLASR